MDKEPKDIKLIFSEALEKKTAKERSAYLDKVCGNDINLRNKIEALLKAYDESDDVPEAPIISQSTFDISPLTEGPGTKIDSYKLLQQIGEGGFGVVYMAEQQEPINRRVALKIIKLGMDTKQVIARFEAERQALALMDHPNIARVFDAGATDTGRPYFVMELVKGIPITEYCDINNLNTRQRLDLFIDVCKAIQHAHQKGIIHRDIKPANVLVTLRDDDSPVPKIIDFGIAKATQRPLTEKTLFTEFRQFVGTPEYMSPEQARMKELDVDTRSDIYSLGVLLYELLTGTTPFEAEKLRSAAYDEICRIIRETEPPKPSTRLNTLGDALSDVAKHRHVQPDQLCKIIRGDLDWVVMKSLEKDRSRRYETANEFAMDIERYLSDEPVSAGPPSIGYRTRKFIRRNRASVTMIITVAAALVVGFVISTTMYFRAVKALNNEAIARTEAEQAEKATKEKSEELRRTLYVNSIQLADAKYSEGNIRRVRELLESCPKDLRGWEWYRLNHISDQSIMTLCGHQDIVLSVAVSPDGNRIASGSADRSIKIWNRITGKELLTISGAHEDEITCVLLSPDGTRLVSGDGSGEIKLWDASTGKEVMTLKGHKNWVFSLALSPDGKRIISCGLDPNIKVWDAETGDELMSLPQNANRFESVAFSPDGKRIVSGGKVIKVWDVDSASEVMTLKGRFPVLYSPDGKRIISGSYDNTIKLWDTATGTELMTLRGHTGPIESIAFGTDSKYIISGSMDNTIKVWDATTGNELRTLRGHEYFVSSVTFTPDGKRVISGSWDSTIKVWDVTIDRELTRLIGHHGLVSSIAFSPDGKQIVSGSVDGTTKVWDVVSGDEVTNLRGHKEPVASVAFSPDGERIVSGSGDKRVKVWDAATGAELMTLSGNEGPVKGVAFSPDGKRIVSGSHKTVKVWDAATGVELMTLRGHERYISSVAFSPDGKRIVSGGSDGEVKVWDLESGSEVKTLRGHAPFITSVSFSSDGKHIASACQGDGTAKIWDATSGKELITLRGHGDIVLSAAFSPNSERIITGSRDRTVRVLDAATGAELMALSAYSGVTSVAFSSDGKTIASGTFGGAILLWASASSEEVTGQ